ncbi:MAG: alpha-galactosidase [Clostridia bacterium]|nr:alpha-galactosidase [Clostridia bacterium]
MSDKYGKTYVCFGKDGHFYLSTENVTDEEFSYGQINANVFLYAGDEAVYKKGAPPVNGDYFRFSEITKNTDGFCVSYQVEPHGLTLTERVEKITGTEAFVQTTVLKNLSNANVQVTGLSRVNVLGVGIGGLKYYETDRFTVHYCYSRWQGEGEWRSKTLRELGFYPATSHTQERASFRIQSIGSFSTGEYYPLLLIEDKQQKECWFFECENAENWFIEINAYGGFRSPFLCVSMGGNEEKLGWKYTLAQGEEYQTSKAVYGVVKGGFGEAIRELTAYKRATSTVKPAVRVTFNDYMNCDWSKPTEERLLPLIDAAAEVGAEIFCIDDGWAEQGVWRPLEEKYPNLGLQGVISYIREKGMTAGIWFEFERASLETAEKIGAEDFLLKRDGAIIAPTRPKLNMRSKAAQAWLLERIDALYAMGVRYIKNDHNNDVGIGTNMQGEAPAEGLRENTEAFYEFIELLKKRYPDLTLENCASGSKRSDNGTLKRFHLQSFSDQEDYRLNPSILIGQMAVMPPEKEGIWSYPYPQLFKDMKEKTLSEEQLESHRDGRQTVFNMVSSMMGYMYLSGRIDLADENNKALIKEAIEVYKTYKDDICHCVPIFDLPMKGMQENDYRVLGLKNQENGEMLLAVWALEEQEFTVALKELKNSRIEKLYPSADNVAFHHDGEKLCCRFQDKYSACLFKILL